MSALVTSDTGIRPTCGKTYFVRLAFQSWACLRLLQPGCICVQTRSAASANVGTPLARRFSASGSPPARASLRLAGAWARASLSGTSEKPPSPISRRRPRMANRWTQQDPAAAARRLDLQVQPVAVAVASGPGDVADEGGESAFRGSRPGGLVASGALADLERRQAGCHDSNQRPPATPS